MQGKQQGPCSLEQLHHWMKLLGGDVDYKEEYEDFKKVSAWQVGHAFGNKSVISACKWHALALLQPCRFVYSEQSCES